MSPGRLLQYFEQISEGPDAVPRLRRFILDLAVRGKLVEQDPTDEPAAELLKRIETESARLVREGTLRSKESQPPVTADEIPFDVPKGWELVRLGKALDLINGRAFKPGEWSNSGLPIIRIQNLNDPEAPFNYCGFSVPDKFLVKTGDFLVSWSGTPGTSFGAHIWDRGPAVLNQHIFRAVLIGDAFLPSFLKLAINSRLLELIDQAHGGVGLQHITKPKLERLPLTLPPLAEQHRTMAKVDELMGLCDKLEAAQAKRERRRDRLVAATLHGLNNGDESAEPGPRPAFEESAHFYFNHLPGLTTRPEHIHQLRQTILNLALRGKLVPQDPKDEPAAELLERIEAEKARLANEEKSPRPKPMPPQNAEDLPYGVPTNWVWSRLAEVSLRIHYGFTASANPTLQDVRLLRITDIQDNKVSWASVPGCEIAGEQVDQYLLADGDILIARTGGTIGKSFLVKDVPVRAVFASYLIRVQGSRELFDRYLKLCLEAPMYWKQLEDGARGTGQPNVNGQTLGNMAIPLPPLAEQHRIVAKVDELMALCDGLGARLTTTATALRQLLEATLHEALEGDS